MIARSGAPKRSNSADMKQPIEVETKLRPEDAFVVQLRSDAEVNQQRICGRIEHVMSGDSAPFASLETLLSFMAKHKSTGSAE